MVTWSKATCPLGYGLVPLSLPELSVLRRLGKGLPWFLGSRLPSQPLQHPAENTDLHLSQGTLPSPHILMCIRLKTSDSCVVVSVSLSYWILKCF